MAAKTKQGKAVDSWRHGGEKRRNIPTAEYESVMAEDEKSPVQVAYQRRNRDLDPQLVWRGKDEQDWSELVVQAPPLYIQEKVHPKVLIEDLLRESKERKEAGQPQQLNLFADFNGLPAGVDGDPLKLEMGRPHGVIAHPKTGEIYIADSDNGRILKIVKE